MDLAHIQNTKIQRSMDLMTLTQVALFLAILLFLLRNYRQLNRSINEPIYRLKTMASRIAQGDLSIRVERPEISELDELTDSLNTMAEKLIELIDQNVQKQRNLQKAEMKALQAQIAPHFMYNTLETILSLAEDGQTENVVTTTIALSSFFPSVPQQGQGLGHGCRGKIPRGELPRDTKDALRGHPRVRHRFRPGDTPRVHAQATPAAPRRERDLPRNQDDPPARPYRVEGVPRGRAHGFHGRG